MYIRGRLTSSRDGTFDFAVRNIVTGGAVTVDVVRDIRITEGDKRRVILLVVTHSVRGFPDLKIQMINGVCMESPLIIKINDSPSMESPEETPPPR